MVRVRLLLPDEHLDLLGPGGAPASPTQIMVHSVDSVPPLVMLFAADTGPGLPERLTETVDQASLEAQRRTSSAPARSNDADAHSDAVEAGEPDNGQTRIDELRARLQRGEEHTGDFIARLFDVSARTGPWLLCAAAADTSPPPGAEPDGQRGRRP